MPSTSSVASAQTDPDRGSAPRHASVRLYDDSGLSWQPVSQRLATVRRVSLTVLLVPVLLVLVPLAVFAWSWFWLGVALAVGLGLWGWWLAGRQVSAISWIEGTEELVVRRGRLFRTVVSVPYGRLQYVDVQSGPLERRFDLATVELHTASPESGGQIPGLPTAEAERLRERLAARGESQRAGL